MNVDQEFMRLIRIGAITGAIGGPVAGIVLTFAHNAIPPVTFDNALWVVFGVLCSIIGGMAGGAIGGIDIEAPLETAIIVITLLAILTKGQEILRPLLARLGTLGMVMEMIFIATLVGLVAGKIASVSRRRK